MRYLGKTDRTKGIGSRQKSLEYFLAFLYPFEINLRLVTGPYLICIIGITVNAFVHFWYPDNAWLG